MLEPHFFALKANIVGFRLAEHAHCPQAGTACMLEGLIFFALDGRLRGIQAGLHTHSAAGRTA
jgi:hypothetical protein